MSGVGWVVFLMSILQVFAWGAFLWDLWSKRQYIASKLSGHTVNNFYVKSNNAQINSEDATIRVDSNGM